MIEFNEENHEYLVDGKKADISITELLRKHGLAPDYSGVDSAILEQARERGKGIHADIEEVAKNWEYEPLTMQGEMFRNWAKENIHIQKPEVLLALKYKDKIFAGTCDLVAYDTDKKPILCDHKCMKQIHKDTVTWQISLYDYILRKTDKKWKGATKILCLQYLDNEMKVHELKKISDEEIEKLLDAEVNGEKYQPKQLEVVDEFSLQLERAELEVIERERAYKEAKENAEQFHKQLYEQMESNNIKVFETPKLKFTYIAPTTRTSVDGKKLQKEYAEIYAQCTKTTNVAGCVKITLKED